VFIKQKRHGKKFAYYLAKSKRTGARVEQLCVYLGDTIELTEAQWAKVCAKGFRPSIWEVAPVLEKFVKKYNLPDSMLVGLRKAMAGASARSRPTSAHRVLGLNAGATQKEVKDAFRRLSRIHHPDYGGDPEEFKALVKARDRLCTTTIAQDVLERLKNELF
jgi:hypothetical protein